MLVLRLSSSSSFPVTQISSLPLSLPSPPLLPSSLTTVSRRNWWTVPRTLLKVSSSSSSQNLNPTVTVSSSSPETTQDEGDDGGSSSSSADWSASEIVRKFYSGINGRDLSSVEDLIADKCVYEDLVFPQPFVGRKAILEFFKEFMDSISKDLQFSIDEISAEDSLAIGVTWHLDWKGKPFPFSRGCSFYRLAVVNGKKQIVYGRDCVEPAIKPGEAALGVIRAVTWLLQKFPQLADKF